MHRFTLLCLLCLFAPVRAAIATDLNEIRAAYLYNFAKFAQWPDESPRELRLCLVGDGDLARSFEGLAGRPVRGMKIVVRPAVALQDMPRCDIVFVPAEAMAIIERVRHAINGYPILLVGETEAALRKGALITLVHSDNRLVFEVDLSGARRRGLDFSAKMLQLARKVH